jgi:DNA-3-methyladenine glycosylase I
VGDTLYEAYHDEEWGVPSFDDQKLFEFLILEGAQAGLSWITVLRKRENYVRALDGFDPVKIASYGERDVERLLNDAGIIRNRLKINSAINNAQRYLDVSQTQPFHEFIWQFVDGVPIRNQFKTRGDVPASTEVSDKMAKHLKKSGFNFVGTTICYAFMQATGMVNDHLVSCFRHEECRQLGQL